MTNLAESLQKCTVSGNILSLPPISEGALPNYPEVRKALLNAGAKYKKNTFVFPSDAQPFIDRLIGGENVNIKKEFQFFPTPDDIADWLVDIAVENHLKPIKGNVLLEPSAGQGAIIRAINRRFKDVAVDFYELMPENSKITQKIPNAFSRGADFLAADITKTKYPLIIANPPFSKNQDIDHIYKMWECLAPNGTIVTIASKHWQFSNGRKESAFRKWVDENCVANYDIERGKFKESGTLISCCILVIKKPDWKPKDH